MNNHTLDLEQPTEATPLLSDRQDYGPGTSSSEVSLEVEPAVIQLQQKGTSSFAESLADLCPQSLSTRAAQASFLLNVLLELRARLHANTVYSEDVWDEWTAERQDGVRNEEVDRQILFTWSDFLRDQRTSDEIVEVLWLAFPLKQGRTETVRVCDFLAAGNAPQGLLTHRVVVLSMVCVWKGGLKTEPEHSIASRYDSGATPR
ncbi:hypothetical protein CERSUDRAFT_90387 [Gelatoporia subvermispora B]|uniref:Uncharacterized protein n=1 Tax=Ceriporiopsis subvermispora (strain B) TaxID=914234 RepID=M2RBH9_CERS8|nr:hypothetical protein CERSUDRAFT_90387 [Gelatoporia subvermispora B]